ncbi:MAG: hypothetical protein LV481_09380 [Methylacidiphilales bacterium]|nr:hypothetical protein [Candidatus Methylacidiphilales bacterium]
MSMVRVALLAALVLAPISAKAGCAVALEIEPNGSLFTHSESSLTPKGGHNYISAADAAAALMAGLKKQGITDAQLIFQSDQTGYFSVAVGHTSDGKVVNDVACAQDPRQSDSAALAALKAKGAIDGAVSGRFHSYGDSANGG